MGLERLRLELRAEGYGEELQIVAMNGIDALDDQHHLAVRCSFPLFQDIPDEEAWDTMDGEKDDFYLYDHEGKLAVFLPANGEISINLATEEGYDNVKEALIGILAN
ncbi:MAG: hypothetical protein V3V08_22475 [Nannocystaceae bacterium]